MTDLYRKMELRAKEYGERMDCTVKCWAVVAGISYDEAWDDLAAVGRKPNRRFRFGEALPRLLKIRDKVATNVTEKWKGKGALTMTTVPRVMPKRGAFIVFCRGHVAAYRAGELHDWTKGRRHRVTHIYRINAEAA